MLIHSTIFHKRIKHLLTIGLQTSLCKFRQ
nr:MAG TPA: hypothetical protein [Bacteriophage sp.]DAO04886.1 MAG TPA: hypothetical protein [Caudoviricetes sp.]DAX95069.1 MAG TPA: hypothetical protein [Caudoviricetes sp.]